MTGENTQAPADGQAPNAATGQAPATSTGQDSGGQSDQQQQTSGQPTSAETLAELTAARAENARLRRENAGYRTAQTRQSAEGQTELQIAQARVAELERLTGEAATREQDRNIRLAAIEEATRLNFRSPDLAYRLLDRAEVDFDDGGTPKNVPALLKKVLDANPYLAKGAGGDFGGGNRGGAPASDDMNVLIRRAANRA